MLLESASPPLDTVEPMRAKRRLSRYRKTQENKRRRELTDALLAELGGRAPSAFESATIANVVSMQVVLDRMATAALNGEQVDLDAQVRLTNAVARLTASFKKRRGAVDAPRDDLKAYLLAKAAAAGSSADASHTKQRAEQTLTSGQRHGEDAP